MSEVKKENEQVSDKPAREKDCLMDVIRILRPFPKETQKRIVDTIIVFLALDKTE